MLPGLCPTSDLSFRKTVSAFRARPVRRLMGLVAEGKTCSLLCACQNHDDCHRRLMDEALWSRSMAAHWKSKTWRNRLRQKCPKRLLRRASRNARLRISRVIATITFDF
ncbi:MAG: hypothetical protein ACLP9L_32305 [Thermoguttaceae bacterium]